jgi:hypothetical protein
MTATRRQSTLSFIDCVHEREHYYPLYVITSITFVYTNAT